MARRRDPFKDIEELFDRLNAGFGELGRELETEFGTSSVLVDVAETDDQVVVTADLPGFSKEDIEVSVKGRQLRVAAQHTDESTSGDDATYHRRERTQRQVSRTVSLPADVEEDGATATYENGVLTVTLPRREPGDDGTDIRVN